MIYWLRCLSAEALKSKRTLALATAVTVPLTLGLLNWVLLLGVSNPRDYATEYGWVNYEHNTITFWSIVFVQSVAVLVTAFVSHQEHDSKVWRRLMCLPVPKAALYLAKLAVVLGLKALSCLLVWAGNIGYGAAYAALRPENGLAWSHIELWPMLAPFVAIYGLALFVIALHYVLSLNVHNFVASIGIGLALALVGTGLHDYALARAVFPWCLPTVVYHAETMSDIYAALAVSGGGFLVTTVAGGWLFVRRDVLS
jgi:ABC-2 type transport system permease protein